MRHFLGLPLNQPIVALMTHMLLVLLYYRTLWFPHHLKSILKRRRQYCTNAFLFCIIRKYFWGLLCGITIMHCCKTCFTKIFYIWNECHFLCRFLLLKFFDKDVESYIRQWNLNGIIKGQVSSSVALYHIKGLINTITDEHK